MSTTELFIPKLVGPKVAAVQIFGVVSVLAGVPTYATVVDFTTLWNEVTLEGETQKVNLASSGSIGAGSQPVLDDFTLTLAGYIVDLTGVTAAVPAALLTAISSHDYFKIVIQGGGLSTTCWVTRGSPRFSLGRENCVESVQFYRADVGTQQNPLFASIL